MAITSKALLLTQNTASSGDVEFEEKEVVLGNLSILIGTDTDGTPGSHNVPTYSASEEDHVLKLKNTGTAWELAWEVPDSINDLPGTDENSFYIGGSTNGGFIHKTPSSGAVSDIEFKNNAGSLIPIKVGTPSDDNHAVTKSYADNLIAANDAMVFGGVVDNQTELETEAGTAYTKGLTFKAGTSDVTIVGKVVEAGDMIIAHADASGTFSDADWSVIQTDITNPVEREGTFTADQLIVGHNSTTAKILDAGTNGKVLKMVSGIPAWADEYSHPTGNGYNHIPADGATTQILQWADDGTAKWVTVSSDIAIADGGGATIQPNVVTPSKMAKIPALRIVGNDHAETEQNPKNLTVAETNALLDTFHYKPTEGVPASPAATGGKNQIFIGGGFVYVHDGTNWGRWPFVKSGWSNT